MTTKNKKFNVICIKWGNKYAPEYVNKLKNMIKRNTSFDIDFYCFTEMSEGLDKDVIIKPLPVMNPKEDYNPKNAYVKEAGLCDDNLGGLTGQRVFFFDLDMLIVGNLDDFFLFPQGDKFYIINDWTKRGERVGQASCYSWVVGTLGFVKSEFEEDAQAYVDKFGTASQEYLSSKVIERFGKLNFWPENWFKSFSIHCLPKIFIFRYFQIPQIPKVKDLKALSFHGVLDMDKALEGIWLDKKTSKPVKSWKRIYKKCLPTPWINDYWK